MIAGEAFVEFVFGEVAFADAAVMNRIAEYEPFVTGRMSPCVFSCRTVTRLPRDAAVVRVW